MPSLRVIGWCTHQLGSFDLLAFKGKNWRRSR
jgi:hypothetical protein